MKKEYKSPTIMARKLSKHLMLETSEINVGGDTDHFDAKENGIFDRLNGIEEEEKE